MVKHIKKNSLRAPVFLFLAIVAGMTACQGEPEEPEAVTEDTATTVQDIEDAGASQVTLGARAFREGANPYIGRKVTVTGEVQDVRGSTAFTMGENEWDDELLVVVPPNAKFSGTVNVANTVAGLGDLEREYNVRATGTVKQYVLIEVEREYGIDLDPTVEAEVEEREPILVADSVTVVPEQ